MRPPFQIVLGSHGFTPVPAAARALGLRHRFAVVQSTHDPASADMVFEPAALLAVLDALDRRPGGPGILHRDEARRHRVTRAELAARPRDPAAEDDRHVATGEWRAGGQTVVLLHTETWTAVGGPAPYHDSLTFSFYSRTDLSSPLFDALRLAGLAPQRLVCGPHRGLPPDPTLRRGWPEWLLVAALGVLLATAFMGLEQTPALGSASGGSAPGADRWLMAGLVLSTGYAAGYGVRLWFRRRKSA